jgi:hypothetical protein
LGLNLFRRGHVPKTAGTLVTIALFVAPFNGLAADRWIFNELLSHPQIFAWGAGLLFLFSLLVSQKISTVLLGIVTGLSFVATLHFLALSLHVGDQVTLIVVALGVCIPLGILFARENSSPWTRGIQTAATWEGCGC